MNVFDFFTRFRQWLYLRVAGVFVAQADADIELQIADARARLLTRAAELDRQDKPGFDQVAAQLRAAADQMAADPATAATRITHQLGHDTFSELQKTDTPAELPAPQKRRGRPPKQSQVPAE